MKVCTQCGTKLGKKDKFCPKCGSSSVSDDNAKIKYCLECGESLDPKAKFCRSCGKPCDGSVSLSFLQERKEGDPDAGLEFVDGPKKEMTPEELAKEKATLSRFEQQIRDKRRKDAEAAGAPVYGAAVKSDTIEKLEPVESVPEFIEEQKAIKNAEIAVAEADRAKMQADNAQETLRRAMDAVKNAEAAVAQLNAALDEAKKKVELCQAEVTRTKAAADVKRAEIEAARIEEERRREEERLRREEEERLRREEEERRRKEEEERLRREEEERRRKEEEERLRREEEERLRREEEERRRKEEEERLRREEEERLRKEEEERRLEEERRRKEEEARIKAEQERRAALEKLHKDVVANTVKALEKYDANPETGRSQLEGALDNMQDFYSKADPDMDITDTEDIYAAMQERLGIEYYKEGSYKLAMPLIDAAIEAGSGRACIYKAEWYSKNRSEVPKEPDFLRNFAMDALMTEPITKEEKLMLYLVLAKTLHDGIGCKRELAEAFTYYEKAANMESPYAYAKVGQCYLYGEGVKKDGKLAFEWSQKAADAGNETGIRNVAVCYDFGTGTKKNADSAIEWYKKLLDKLGNDRFAMFRIALCLADPDKEYGRRPTEAEYAEAYEYATKAVAGGEENANYIIGYLYMIGKGVSRDFNKAVSHFTSAANYGNSKAKDKLKLFVKNGSNYSLK